MVRFGEIKKEVIYIMKAVLKNNATLTHEEFLELAVIMRHMKKMELRMLEILDGKARVKYIDELRKHNRNNNIQLATMLYDDFLICHNDVDREVAFDIFF